MGVRYMDLVMQDRQQAQVMEVRHMEQVMEVAFSLAALIASTQLEIMGVPFMEAEEATTVSKGRGHGGLNHGAGGDVGAHGK